jgi:nucleotide-binding universal stress UspA family protein
MTFMIAFDGSTLSEAALRRGIDLGEAVDEPVVVVSVIPTDSLYARRQGWVERERAYDPAAQAEAFRERVAALAPSAEFRVSEIGDDVVPRDVAKELRKTAYDLDASVVVLGSENAGRVVAPVSSVGDTVVSSPKYDVYIVRDTVL